MIARLTALLLAATSPAQHGVQPAARCVQILGTNDLHGHLSPEPHSAGALTVEQGGLSTLGGYLAILRARYPGQVLLVDGGDLFQGTMASNLSKGAAVIAAYNVLGYRASAVGNHEFDFGPVDHGRDPLGTLERRLREAHFPFLACNLYEKDTGKRPAWRHLAPGALVTVNGVRVGLVGAVTPDTPTVTDPRNVVSLSFRDPVADVGAEAAKLRKQGAQLVVGVAHIGGACTDTSNPNDLASCKPNSDVFKLLRGLPPGTLDVMVGGHTHQYIAQRVNGVATVESGSYGHSFGWVQACVDGSGAVTTTVHPPVDVCVTEWAEGGCRRRTNAKGTAQATFLGQKVVPDARVTQVLAPFLAQVKVKQSERLGVTLTAPAVRIRTAESPLGELVAQAMRASVKGAEIGLTNAGGIRADLPQGPLTYGQVFEVLPFDNRVIALELTGQQLHDLVVAPLLGDHGWPQLAGAVLHYDRADPARSTLTLDDGKPLDLSRTYRVATNDFLANGGDGTQAVMAGIPASHRQPPGVLLRDALLAYLKVQPEPVKVPTP